MNGNAYYFPLSKLTLQLYRGRQILGGIRAPNSTDSMGILRCVDVAPVA